MSQRNIKTKTKYHNYYFFLHITLVLLNACLKVYLGNIVIKFSGQREAAFFWGAFSSSIWSQNPNFNPVCLQTSTTPRGSFNVAAWKHQRGCENSQSRVAGPVNFRLSPERGALRVSMKEKLGTFIIYPDPRLATSRRIKRQPYRLCRRKWRLMMVD